MSAPCPPQQPRRRRQADVSSERWTWIGIGCLAFSGLLYWIKGDEALYFALAFLVAGAAFVQGVGLPLVLRRMEGVIRACRGSKSDEGTG